MVYCLYHSFANDTVVMKYFLNYFPARGDFYNLLIYFANGFGPRSGPNKMSVLI